ncbi:MAG: SUMF1/EgtB/PvdO family nonheme iron enzyme [Cellvibrionaceae bacterium]
MNFNKLLCYTILTCLFSLTTHAMANTATQRLLEAAKTGDAAVVTQALSEGAKIEAVDKEKGSTALIWAALKGHHEAVKTLVKAGAAVNAKDEYGNVALHKAASYGHESVVSLLLKEGAAVNEKDNSGNTALHEATKKGHESVVSLLLKSGAAVNAKTEKGVTALHRAVRRGRGYESVVSLLLKEGAAVNAKDEKGVTALHKAARISSESLVSLLLKEGASADGRDNDGWTALHKAVRRGRSYESVVSLLLKAGAAVNVKNNDGRTALHIAALKGNSNIASGLLKAGAKVNTMDNKGITPLMLASNSGDDEIVATLEKAGGETNPAFAAGVVKEIEAQMVSIPGGSFMMGSNEGDSDEKPVHRVQISPFKMGKYEITWAQYQPCIDEGACPYNDGDDEGWGKGNRPMINVSWNNITQHYIPWLNRKTGKRFRLPTEAEWEYAARAGSTSKYSWGNSIDCSKARYGYYSNECGKQKSTDPVGSFAPNVFGLYDMHGNVWEWVQDCYHDSYSGAPSDGSAWKSGESAKRVLRGGSWADTPAGLRSAYRYGGDAGNRNDYYGFRLVQDN